MKIKEAKKYINVVLLENDTITPSDLSPIISPLLGPSCIANLAQKASVLLIVKLIWLKQQKILHENIIWKCQCFHECAKGILNVF